MGVRAQYGRHPPVQEPPHHLHVAGGLGVEVDQNHANVVGQFPQHAVGRVERAVDRRHEHPAQETEHRDLDVPPSCNHRIRLARRLWRIVGRFDNAGFAVHCLKDLAPSISVVAHRHAIDAGVDQFAIVCGRKTRAAGRILGVGHDQVQLFLDPQTGNRLDKNPTPRFSDNVTNKKQSHALVFLRGMGCEV